MDAIGIYSLKLYDRTPDDMPLDRLAEYIKEFIIPGNGWATEPDPLALWRSCAVSKGKGLIRDASQ